MFDNTAVAVPLGVLQFVTGPIPLSATSGFVIWFGRNTVSVVIHAVTVLKARIVKSPLLNCSIIPSDVSVTRLPPVPIPWNQSIWNPAGPPATVAVSSPFGKLTSSHEV